MTQVLLSVPPAASSSFLDLAKKQAHRFFACHDPVGKKLGSGAGSAHLIHAAWQAEGNGKPFADWAAEEKRVLLHAGGQSRRLPAYAAAGKALIPVPIFRWMKGQRLDQTLLDLQLPLLEKLLDRAPSKLRWLIASGDVLIWNEDEIGPLPEVDVLCVGLWNTPERASKHGVFFSKRETPDQLDYILQKPSVQEIQARTEGSLFLLDIGIWLFSDRAIELLMKRSGYWKNGQPCAPSQCDGYDLYGDFALNLGSNPTTRDEEISSLSCGLVDLPNGEFYHFGTNDDIIASSLALQNRVNDQRRIRSPLVKPHPSIFIQNANTDVSLSSENRCVWIENAFIGSGWRLNANHILTGIPENQWQLELPRGACLDFAAIGDSDAFVVRFYGYSDVFKGRVDDRATQFCEEPFADWLGRRGLSLRDLGIAPETDLQSAALFPSLKRQEISSDLLTWLISRSPQDDPSLRQSYLAAPRLSAEEIGAKANLKRSFQQRESLLIDSLPLLAKHAQRSVFHQIDLAHAAERFASSPHELPTETPDPERSLLPFVHDQMFRATVSRLRKENVQAYETAAFEALSQAIISPFHGNAQTPRNTSMVDQVIWGRSPARLDLAGGWSDTPPYCFLSGGNVVNVAVDLNGQPPIQVFARVCQSPHIVIHSIDLGVSIALNTYQDIAAYAQLESGFAIPRAALALAGFHPDFLSKPQFVSLEEQLNAFGGGIEISLLCAVPKGSGLGTSSILAATLLGVLSDLCGLGWSLTDIGRRALALEQMLTSGGGWQDQFGGIHRGLKLLQTRPGLEQTPEVRWLPEHTLSDPQNAGCCLLYYTGVTRVARNILADIVRGMFLNKSDVLGILDTISQHAVHTARVAQRGSYQQLADCVRQSWILNQALDAGTNPSAIQSVLESISDWVAGMKLLGAGGGGYLLIMAKDPHAAALIRQRLENDRPNAGARFVDLSISQTGLRITRS
ncbi:bifunctional fucokinase/fucose-1-phosphate guanylyltransferase [Pelagicoccus sp. SDUM812003]|uniref:bifunctional fucokinase/fucose-1-phosphate guanylyltransferase n=1 Tax=Pelagicoccus sp. SDUM812003 TaxID=3041267 RepID=UPI00280F304A|nr:bifunctional fucokinase/fucose-1-phosphate guanylyltransferase [Pelagicoccus sp. SDUM812003]MDQ8201741.1 bifunctional fucokinase/fucose-1-phosphate guanylyltransferase [Pelagicoccus sp. SDUM812003]